MLFDFIEGRVTKDGVRDWIRLSTSVRFVTYDPASAKFTVSVHDLVQDRMYAEVFHHVIVASDHFSTPNVPEFPEFPAFYGHILHAHDFRDAREFTDKDIQIVGTLYSAEDNGSQCWKYGCKAI